MTDLDPTYRFLTFKQSFYDGKNGKSCDCECMKSKGSYKKEGYKYGATFYDVENLGNEEAPVFCAKEGQQCECNGTVFYGRVDDN